MYHTVLQNTVHSTYIHIYIYINSGITSLPICTPSAFDMQSLCFNLGDTVYTYIYIYTYVGLNIDLSAKLSLRKSISKTLLECETQSNILQSLSRALDNN